MDQEEPVQQYFLYAWGRNKDGELSIVSSIYYQKGNQKKTSIPKPVQGIKGQQVLTIGSGQNHSAIVTKEGQIYICGSALHGKLGLEDQNQPSYPKFQLLTALKDLVVRQVAAGDYHTLALLENGQVYAWGGTLHKKLGQRTGKPSKIDTLKLPITAIGCGDFHSAALAENGALYTWGGGGRDYNRGQLGHGHLNDVEVPMVVKEQIVKFSCGGYHMMALDSQSQLWSWGSGVYGETGQGEFVDSLVPKKVTVNFNQKNIIIDDFYLQNRAESLIKDISCGGRHSIVLSTKGLVYACGYAQNGQLGTRSTDNQSKFQLVVGLVGKTIVQIAAGWNHSVILSSNSDVYTCGHNKSGQLGLDDEETKTQYTRVSTFQSKRIHRIFAGGNHTWVLIDYNHPRIDNYQPPSPIQEENKIDSLSQAPEQLNDLEILVSDVKYNHRFVKVQVPTGLEVQAKARLNEYINTMQKDQSIKLTKYQNDQEASGILTNYASFTVLIVADVPAPPAENLEDGTITPVGKGFILKRSNIKKNAYYDWIIQAEKVLAIPNVNIKFYEIRPQ